MRIILSITFIFLSTMVFSQQERFYVIEFTDKYNSPYSLTLPNQFLSQKSIERRINQEIAVDSTDFPPNPWYVDSVRNYGVDIWAQSRWFNLVVIRSTDTNVISQIQNLPFVKKLDRVKREKNKSVSEKFKLPESQKKVSSIDYGSGFNQVNMIGADFLHSLGYKGEDMVIAVLDAGFYKVDSLPAFDSLRVNNQILGTWDFVRNEPSVYEDHTHGMHVLSTMGGNLPGELVGTAPKANYWLLRSEDAATETISEEYFWISAAEFADSVGADLINSSLGYTVFDSSAWDHTYSDLDGNTTVITRGADMAASKGILVVNSAGNSGSSPWRYIGAPADGDSVLAVGAVDSGSNFAFFSSHGPSADGDVKPNVAAQGQQTIIAGPTGGVVAGNGTSFSSPVLAGAVACLWQAKKSANNMDVIRSVEKSAHQFHKPDTLLGYGIPDMALALYFLGVDIFDKLDETLGNPFPNPFTNNLTIPLAIKGSKEIIVSITDVTGREILNDSFTTNGQPFIYYTFENIESLPSGIYYISVQTEDKFFVKPVIKGGH